MPGWGRVVVWGEVSVFAGDSAFRATPQATPSPPPIMRFGRDQGGTKVGLGEFVPMLPDAPRRDPAPNDRVGR